MKDIDPGECRSRSAQGPRSRRPETVRQTGSQALLVQQDLRYKPHSSVVGTVGRFLDYREQLDTGLPAQLQTERERCDYELERYSPEYVERRLREVSRFIEQSDVLVRE